MKQTIKQQAMQVNGRSRTCEKCSFHLYGINMKVCKVCRDAFVEGYLKGRKQAFEATKKQPLDNKFHWVNVNDSLPNYDEDVLVTDGSNRYWFSHIANAEEVITDNNGFSKTNDYEINYWTRVPKVEWNINNKNK